MDVKATDLCYDKPNKKRLETSLLNAARCGQTIADESLFALTL